MNFFYFFAGVPSKQDVIVFGTIIAISLLAYLASIISLTVVFMKNFVAVVVKKQKQKTSSLVGVGIGLIFLISPLVIYVISMIYILNS